MAETQKATATEAVESTRAPSATATPTSTSPAGAMPPLAASVDAAHVSQVLPATAQPPAPHRSSPTVPAGASVVWGGCASDGECHHYNFYWAPTHEIVMQYGEQQTKVQHEACHAHQHLSINGGGPVVPSDYDLASWYGTAEGRSFSRAVDGLSWPWSHSAVSPLEDFAWTCAYWYTDAAYLQNVSPRRYDWAVANLP